jgi:transcriptional regulator with XRE-family HTH domain
MTLGAEVRRLRVAGGLTQRELAEPAYSRAFVAAIESGARIPSEEALAHIAARLGVAADDLRHGRPGGIAEVLAARLAEARRRLSHGESEAAAAEFDAVRAEAAAYQLPEIVGWAEYYLGDVLLHRGEVTAATEAYRAVAAAAPEGAVKLRAAVTARLGYSWFALGETQRALVLLEGQLRTLRAAPHQCPDAQMRVASMLMYTYNELDWNDRARQLEHEILPLVPWVTDIEWIAQFHSIAAQLRRDASELDDVERLLSQAERHYAASDLKREIGVCHWARGYVLRRADRLAEAEAEFRTARAVLTEVGAVQDLAGATVELAEVLRRRGILDEAAELAAEAARTSTLTGHSEGMAEADRLLGLVAGQRGEAEAAERYLTSAADRYDGAGLMAELVTTCGLLGDLLLHAGRRDEAIAVLRRGLRGAEKIR